MMTTARDRQPLERRRYWRGQRLRGADFRDHLAGDDQRRWWHNRAVHNAYGVARGLAIGLGVDADGTPLTVVLPGEAYDAFGRELAVAEPTSPRPPAPAEPEGWTLLLRREERAAELVWRPTRGLGVKDGVPLARGAHDENNVFQIDPGFAPPRVRPLAKPLIAEGRTVPGETAWRRWSIPILGNSGIEVRVDTSAAGFTEVPCYFAMLHGDLWCRRGYRPLVVERITDATPESFTYSLWEPRRNVINIAISVPTVYFYDPLLHLARQELYVCWLGIQESPRISTRTDHEHS